MPEAADDLRRLRSRDRKIFNRAIELIDEICADPDEIGYELEDEWVGAKAIHFWNDSHRLIWEVDLEDELVIVLRVGKRFGRGRRPIYEDDRPIR